MKKILLALAFIITGVALAVLVLYFRTNTLVVERDLAGVPVIEISGMLDQAGARKVIRALRRAESCKPALIVVSLDSPGGLVTGALEVADVISSLSVRTAGLVKDGMGSTVFLIAAVDRIYFSAKGVCGAASLVVPSDDPETAAMLQKIQTYAGSRINQYAETNGHAPDTFRAMIDPNAELIRGTKVWKKKGEMMSLTASEALEIGLSAGTLESPDEVITNEKKIEANKGTTNNSGALPLSVSLMTATKR